MHRASRPIPIDGFIQRINHLDLKGRSYVAAAEEAMLRSRWDKYI